MKSLIFGQINKNENFPLFSIQYYDSLQVNQEKCEYLLNYLQYFLSRFDQQNFQRQKIQPSLLQSFKDFSETLSINYSILLPDNFDQIIKILSIENAILEVIPNASNFLQLIDLIFYQCYLNSDPDIQKKSNNAILALFSNKFFCKAFVNSGKYLDTISALVTYSNHQLTNFFFDYFLNDNFIQCFIEDDIKQNTDSNKKEDNMNCSKFVFSYFSKIFLSETTKDEVRYQLIEFGSKLIVNIFNSLDKKHIKINQFLISNLFIDELSKSSLFEKANKFFISHPSLSFMSMFYNNLLLNLNNDNNNQQFNQNILNHLHSLYIDDKFKIEDGKVVIMHFFQTLNINYFSNKNNFQILDWIIDSVFQSSLLFQVTSSFLTKLVYYDTSYLSSFINFFIQKVAPPAKEKFVYNEIFTFFLSLISLLIEDENKKNNLNQNTLFIEEKFDVFDVHNFLQKIIYEPSISDVSFYLIHFFNFKQLLLHISILCKENNKRNSNAKKITFSKEGQIIEDNNNLSIQLDDSIFDEQYFSKIIELIEFNLNEDSLQEFFLNYLKNSFGKNLVLYFFQNILKSNHVQILLFSFAQEFTNELIEIITSYKLLDEIISNINEQNISPILKIINSIVIKTNNHFFDDYIINNFQPDKFLKLDFSLIEKFILPAFYDEPIPIPSLIPFLFIKDEIVSKEKLNFKSPYNHYLLGCYAMPIYNKLNISVSKIICLEEIFNQFIRYKDFCYVFQNGAKDASMVIQSNKKPEFSSNIYEIFPSEKPACILLNITSPYCAFKIKFVSKHHFPSVLFNVNGSPFLFVKDDILIDISNTSIGKIQLNKWHTISFIYKQNIKTLSIGLDSEIVSSLSITSYKIDSIGSIQKPASIHYMIMNSISLGNSQENSTFSEEIASKIFKPQGNILFVPNYSFHHLFQSRHAFSSFCEMIEKTINVNDSKKIDNEIKKIYNNKTALFVSLMNNWISSNNVYSEWHLNRYRYCLMQNVSYCEPFYLTSILQTIICLNNKTDRTKLFYSFICDFFFWIKFPERIVGQCLDFINNFIDDFPSVFDLKMLEETTIGNFLLSISYFYRNSYILNGLIRFLKTLFTFSDEKYVIPILSNFSIISPYLNVEEMEMLFNFEKGQNFSNTIISLAKEIRKTRSIKLFKVEDLLSFSLMVNNQQLDINFIIRILIFCESDQFVQQNLSILCRIVQRFPSNNLIWQKLFQLITNDKNFVLSTSNINQYNFNNNGIRISILPLILSALIPLFNEESMFTENIKKIVFRLLKENQLNLISKNTIKIFCSFLKGSIFGLVQPSLINQTIPQNPKIQDFYSIFVDNLNQTFVSSKNPNPSFYKYTAMLLCSMLLTQVSNFKRFSLILNVAFHSSNFFLIETLITLYSTYIHFELTSQQLTLLNDISLYAFLKEKDIKNRDNLSNNIFVYCIHKIERFFYFSKFFVFSYRYVTNDVKFRTLRAFKECFNIQSPKTLNEITPYLYIIICTDLNQIVTIKKGNLIKKGENNSPKSIVSNERKRRLMNLKAKEPNKVKDDVNSSLNQINSFASEIFNYFLTTFKQFPKENKLSLLLKYKDFNDLKVHQNENDENLNQVKNYISVCIKNLQDEFLNNYKIVELKGATIPQDNLGTFLFAHFTDITQRCKNFFNTLISDMNIFIRHVEKYYGSFIYINNTINSQNFSYDMLSEINQSRHVSPFYFPGFCPVVLMPSPFSVLNNNNNKNVDFGSNKIKIELFGLEKLNSFICYQENGSKIGFFNKFDGFFDYQNKNHRMKISFIHNTNVKKHKINVYYLHLNSEIQQQEKILLFESLYGRPLQILNCNLIRKFIDIPAVLFKYKNRYLILPNFQFDGEEINHTNETIESTLNLTSIEYFYQSIFLNEFGQYYLFLGHPVIHVHFNDFVISHQCTDDTVTFSVGIFSTSNGSFALSFNRENVIELQQKYQQHQQQQQQNEQLQQVQEENVVDPPSIYMMTNSEILKQSIIDKWLNGKLSNIHYLTLLNLISGRSFDDLASYPIMPRVLSSFNGKSFKEVYRNNLRNLEFPVSVLSEAMKSKSQTEFDVDKKISQKVEDEFDVSSSYEVDLTDPCFNTLKMRYEMQKYHNCENISNGSIVSSFLVRIPPFVNYSLEFNDGNFDAPDRMFSSIELSCGISKFSTSELLPELFLMPEMLTNQSNKIKFPEGVPDEVTLPQWSQKKNNDVKSSQKVDQNGGFDIAPCCNFIQMHRSVLESFVVRRQISKWIDLVFGFKQSGEEAVNSFNVYNPLSYQSSVGSQPALAKSSTLNLSQIQIKTIRADFVKNSGQMPLKIFSSPHQSYSIASKEVATNVSSSASLFSIGSKEKRSSPIKKRIQPLFDKNSLFGFTFDDVVVRLKQKETIENAVLNREKGEILINMTNYTYKMYDFDFFNAIHISLSKRGDFLAVTFCTSKVKIFRLFYFDVQHQNQSLLPQNQYENENNFSFNEISVLSRESLRFSVVNDRENICVSVCNEEVILWSIINGFIIHIIPIKNAKCLVFDEVLNLIYIGVGSKIYQFSINGHLLSKIETNFEKQKSGFGFLFDSVESVAVGGFGFSYDTRFIAVGKRSGNVMIYRQNTENLNFEIVSIFEVSSYPIIRLITKQNNFLVEAVDSYENSSTVF